MHCPDAQALSSMSQVVFVGGGPTPVTHSCKRQDTNTCIATENLAHYLNPLMREAPQAPRLSLLLSLIKAYAPEHKKSFETA